MCPATAKGTLTQITWTLVTIGGLELADEDQRRRNCSLGEPPRAIDQPAADGGGSLSPH